MKLTTLPLIVSACLLLNSCGYWKASRTDDSSVAGPKSMYHSVDMTDKKLAKTVNYGCSFVEFDHSGDVLDSKQLTDCVKRIQNLPEGKTPLVFIYCHGWHNNSQSNDVLNFRKMLSHFATLEYANYAVHGVYLAWPASTFSVPGQGDMKNATKANATGIGSSVESVWLFNYWAKKSLASNRIGPSPRFKDSITQICRTTRNKQGRIVATGHSFGALVLERAIAYDMFRDYDTASGKGDLPDLMFFFNSAAHATDAYQAVSTMSEWKTPGNKPRVVSVTTRRDFGTSVAHFTGNVFSGFSQWNQRWHGGKYPQSSFLFETDLSAGMKGWTLDPDKMAKMFESDPKGTSWFWRESVHAAELQRRTPGHTDMLISHGFTLVDEKASGEKSTTPDNFSSAALFNMTAPPMKDGLTTLPDAVLTCVLPTKEGNRTWNLHPLFPKNDPRLEGKFKNQTPYWVIPLPDAVLSDPRKGIQNHNEVWTQGHYNLMSAFMKKAEIINPQRIIPKRDQIERSIEADTLQRQSTDITPAPKEGDPQAVGLVHVSAAPSPPTSR